MASPPSVLLMHNGNGTGQQSKHTGAVLPKPPPILHQNGNPPARHPTKNPYRVPPRELSTLEKSLAETLEKAEAVHQAGSKQFTDLLRTEIRDLQVRLNASLEESNRLRTLHDTAIVQGTKLLQQAVDLNAELARERQKGKASSCGQESNLGEWSMPERQAELDVQADKHQSEKARLQARIKEMEVACQFYSQRVTAAQQQVQEMSRKLLVAREARDDDKREHEKLIAMARADGEAGKENARLRYEKELAAHRSRIEELQGKLDEALVRDSDVPEDIIQKRTRIITNWYATSLVSLTSFPNCSSFAGSTRTTSATPILPSESHNDHSGAHSSNTYNLSRPTKKKSSAVRTLASYC